jgi:predicted nucleotidyltransferase
MSVQSPTISPDIREDVLTDPRYPVHRIADRLRPYLRVLVDQFRPEMVVLFGSWAYGQPKWDSDIDLLIVKEPCGSRLAEAIAIRRAWWAMPRDEPLPAFDLLVVDWQRHHERLAHAAGFYDTIVAKGLRLV